jgi:hypothetical protein
MKNLKQIPMAMIMLGLGAASSFAEIKLNDNFSVTGFLDMSALGNVPDKADNTLTAEFDQFETDFLFKYGFFSARADINYLFAKDNEGVQFEQGFVTANVLKDVNVTVGRFLSASGFEAAEPTGLYQFSTSKLLTGIAGATYGGYENGLNVSYVNPMFGLYGAVVTNVWEAPTTNDLMYPGFEAQLALTPMEGLTAKVTWLTKLYNDTADTGHDNQNELNAWASFAKGPLTVAAEYSYLINWVAQGSGAPEQNGNGWLVMGNFKATDKIAATVRYSGIKMEDVDDVDQELTFSPSFAVSPNWLTLAEVRWDFDPTNNFSYAFESTYSF